jgi:hypothetical protein
VNPILANQVLTIVIAAAFLLTAAAIKLHDRLSAARARRDAANPVRRVPLYNW